MSPDLEKEVIVGVLSALFTALFAGIPGAALFWWTYQRDQERLVIEKLFREKRVLIRNRSLFPVHISYTTLEIDGQRFVLNYYPQFAPDTDPQEIPSLSNIVVRTIGDLKKIEEELARVAQRDGVSAEDVFMSPKVVAVVRSETGRRFTSLRLLDRVKTILAKALLAPE